MIFVLDDSIRNADVKAKSVLAKLVIAIIEKKHYIKVPFQIWQWMETEVLTTEFIGNIDIELIQKNAVFRDITRVMDTYLSQISVGFGQGYVEPSYAMSLVNAPSYVVVENESYDWPVLRKWIELMKNDREFKSINSLVEKKKCIGELRPYNAGSSGQIINTLTKRKAEFNGLAAYKIMAVYDSDKDSKGAELSPEKKKIQDFSTQNRLSYHILYKREIENYFDLECYKKAQLADAHLNYTLSVQEWDFEDVETYINNNSRKHYNKHDLPLLSNYIDKQKLINITAHHLVEHNGTNINEIQSLILKFAKLV